MKRAELIHAIRHASSVYIEVRLCADTESVVPISKQAALDTIEGILWTHDFFARESGTTVVLGADTRRED